MNTLGGQTDPLFVRCVKPNEQKQPRKADKVMVLEQLRCGGVLEAIRISRAGYPNRRTYDDFYKVRTISSFLCLPSTTVCPQLFALN